MPHLVIGIPPPLRLSPLPPLRRWGVVGEAPGGKTIRRNSRKRHGSATEESRKRQTPLAQHSLSLEFAGGRGGGGSSSSSSSSSSGTASTLQLDEVTVLQIDAP